MKRVGAPFCLEEVRRRFPHGGTCEIHNGAPGPAALALTGVPCEKCGPVVRFETADHVAPSVIERYRDDAYFRVSLLRDTKGRIGGYMLQPAIMDDPISYLDCRGDFLTSFHILGSDEEKENAMRIVTALIGQFPIQEALKCDPSPG